MPYKILIIGGTGNTGQWFVKFYKKHGFDVTVWGVNKREDIAKQLGVKFAHDLDNEIKKSDIVLISVPIDKTTETIKNIAPKMKPKSLLMDITSIKSIPIKAMLEYAPKDVEILGTHPMFGPSIPDIRGQIVILVPERCEKWFSIICSLYENSGAHIEIMDAKQHDKIMSVVQGLTHFAMITIGSTFRELELDVNNSRRFMSPMYDILIDLVGRILAQNPYLYAMIQMNPEVKNVHKAYISQCIKLADIVKNKDIDGFVDVMKKAAVHFKDSESALRRSEKLIRAKISEHEKLVNSIGCESALKHIYSNVVHFGIIKKVTPRKVILESHGKNTELLIENVRLLDKNEFLEWKIKNLRKIKRDISVFIPENSDPEIIKKIISDIENVVSVEIIDKYQKDNKKSVTYRLVFIDNPNITQKKVEEILKGIGCVVR